MKNILRISVLITLPSLIAPVALAGEFTVGAGAYKSQSPYTDYNDTSGGFPLINYQGEGWSLGESGASIDLIGDEDTAVKLSAALTLNRSGFDDADSTVFSGMKKRDNSVDLGLAVNYKLGRGSLRASLMGDVSSTHKGYLFDVNYSQGVALLGGFFKPGIGLKIQSSGYTDYYYGVRPNEATANRKAYSADGAVNPYIEYSYSYPINDNIMLLQGANFTKLDTQIKDSSVVDRNNTWSTFVGIGYTF